MKKLLSLRVGWAFALYALLDLLCTGMGMGVPFFCILFGLPVGGYLTLRIATQPFTTRQWLSRTLKFSALTSAFSMFILLLVWMSSLLMLFDPAADLANYGIPQILFEPKASFIGWMVLMILISPFLQFLMTLFGSHLALLLVQRRNVDSSETRGRLDINVSKKVL